MFILSNLRLLLWTISAVLALELKFLRSKV
jgi:hypothetical protein